MDVAKESSVLQTAIMKKSMEELVLFKEEHICNRCAGSELKE